MTGGQAHLTQKRGIISWIFPSIGDVIFLCLFFWLLSIGSGLLNDGDTGWHIVTGRAIIDTLKIPFSDPYSYTLPATPWTAHEWLAEVIFAAVDRAAGLNGVVIFTAAVICLTYLALYKFITRIGVGHLTAAMLTVVAALASTIHWLARPHVFSFPLTLAFIAVLEDFQRGRCNRAWALPLLMVFWANVHGGYMLGIMLVGLYAGGNLLLHLVSGGPDEHLARFKKLALVLVAVLLAACVNPHGPMILYFPFHLVGREYIMDNVQEWLSPNFHTNRTFELMLFVFIFVFVMSRRKLDIFEGGVSLMLLHMSLYSARYIPLMALTVTPMAAVRAGEVMEQLTGFAPGVRAAKKLRDSVSGISGRASAIQSRLGGHLWIYAILVVCFVAALNGGSIAGRRIMDYGHNPKRFPVAAMDFAVGNGISGRMFNNDSWGGYIIYKTHPRYKVFFDGRSDMYGVEFMKEYAKVAKVKLGYTDVLDKYGVEWVIFNANAPICLLLAETGQWKLIYADETANILVKDIPKYKGLIGKYAGVEFVEKADDEDG